MKKSLLVAAIALGLTGCAHMPGAQTKSGWTTLVDGTGMTNFEPVGDANWRVVDGAIVATKGVGFLLTRESYGDFELRAEFYAESDTNSGIFIRCSERVKINAENCYEVNIWDTRPKIEYGTGAIVDVAPVSNPPPKVAGKWNTYEITAKGDHMIVVLNGVKTAEGRHAKHVRGPIGLQYAQGNTKDSGVPIKFRKVQIRPL
jgi:hypothetical protein